MRGIVIGKMLIVMLWLLYLAVGLSQPSSCRPSGAPIAPSHQLGELN